MKRFVLLLVTGLLIALGPALPALAQGQGPEDWDGLSLLRALLTRSGYSIVSVSEVPEEPLPGVLLVTLPTPDTAQLRGLWSYVKNGGGLVLPLEVPVQLDDPLVRTVSVNGGVKVRDKTPGENYRAYLDIPLATIRLKAGPPGVPGAGAEKDLTLCLNMPTHLAPFSADGLAENAVVSVQEGFYGPGAYLEGSSSGEGGSLYVAVQAIAVGNGRAVVVADYSVLINQMLRIPANRTAILAFLDWARCEAKTVYWLEAGTTPPAGRGPGDQTAAGHVAYGGNGGGGGGGGSGGSGGGGWTPNWHLPLVAALPLALVPYALRRPRWRPEDYLRETASETTFRRLVRGTLVRDDYRLPARYLAAELRRILPGTPAPPAPARAAPVVGTPPASSATAKTSGRLVDRVGDCVSAYTRLHPRGGTLRRVIFRERCAWTLRRLDRWEQGGARIPGQTFLRVYGATQRLLKEIGGTGLYGQGAFARGLRTRVRGHGRHAQSHPGRGRQSGRGPR